MKRDMQAHGARLPDYPWDNALLNRRNKVIGTYLKAAGALALPDDPEDRRLAQDTERFAARMTGLTTERAQIASIAARSRTAGNDVVRDRGSKDVGREPPRGPEKGGSNRER